MQTKEWINIHRHGPAHTNEWAIENRHAHFQQPLHGFYSAGIHPWYIDAHWETYLQQIHALSTQSNMMAIGECGLDRICTTPFSLQQKVFAAQISLANQLNKPIIIHAVRTHEQVLQLLKKEHNEVPVIFHGYNKGLPLAIKIQEQGYYLSFGKDLLKPATSHVLAQLNPAQLFLETDGTSMTIEAVYQQASAALNISPDELSLQLYKNRQRVFNLQQ